MIREVKLGEICNILNGYAFKSKEYVEDGIRIIRITNVQKGIIQDTDPKYYKIDKIETLKNYMLKENDLLISLTGNVGRVGQISKELLPAGLNQRVGCIRIKEEKDVSIDYLYQYFNSYNFERDCINNSKGIAQKNLSTEWLKNYKMKIPSLDEQKRIAIELRHIQRIKDLKQQQLKELDQLIKSQFVEMFGEPLISNNYGRITLDKLIKVSQGLQIPIGKRKNDKGRNRYKYITIQYLNGSKKEEYIENPNERVICNKEDILMTRTGNTGQVITNVEGVFHNNFFKMDYDRKIINKEFLIKYFENELIYKDIIRRATTSTIPDLSHSQFYKMSIDLPPLELQNQFSQIVKQIDKQKFEIEKSLKEIQELYESLMEKYFG